TMPEAVDTTVVPNSPADTRAEMHLAGQFDPTPVNDPSRQPLEGESWRAEVASRVNKYRTLRKRPSREENFPVLDFGPAAEEQTLGTPNAGDLARTHRDALARAATKGEEARCLRSAFDTNYYRRLNAESMAHSSTLWMSA